jgi:CHAT domain-containing protein/tetratricopeptide (TPR) repeat protein
MRSRILHRAICLRFTLVVASILTACALPAQQSTPDQEAILNEADRLHVQVEKLNAEGKYTEALPLAVRMTELWQQVRDDSVEVSNCLCWVGQLRESLGDHAGAEKDFERALNIRLKALPPNHPFIASGYSNLAIVEYDLGHYQAAVDLELKAIAILEKSPSGDHGGLAAALDELGMSYQALGRYGDAETALLRSLELMKKQLGTAHPDYATALHNLAYVYQAQAKYVDAIALFQQALGISENALGPEHPRLAPILSALSEISLKTSQFDEAERLERRALAIRQKHLPADHPEIAQSLGVLATIAFDQNKFEEAERLYRQVLAIYEKSLPENHPYRGSGLENLATALQAQEKFAAAEELYRQAIAIREQALGPEHPELAASLYNLMSNEVGMKQWDAAADTIDRERHISHRYAAQVLPGLSASQQLMFLVLHDSDHRSAAWSFGLLRRNSPEVVARSAEWLLNGKGVAQEVLTQNVRLLRENNNPQVSEALKKLFEVRRQLATLVMNGRNSGGGDYDQQVAQLEGREKQLDEQVSKATGRVGLNDAWLSQTDFRGALPHDAVFIGMAWFYPYNFDSHSRKDAWKPLHYAAWIIPPANQGDIQIVDLGEAQPIDDCIEEVQHAMRDASGGGAEQGLIAKLGEKQAEQTVRQPLSKLAQLIWTPLEKQLGDKVKQLLLSPDGPLWLVPWGALPMADDRYVIEAYPVRYLVSGRELLADNSVDPKLAQPVVFADPNYDLTPTQVESATRSVLRSTVTQNVALRSAVASAGQPLSALHKAPRLRGTADEAAFIVPSLTQLTHSDPITYLDKYATEGVFKALKSPNVLVLSTHGFVLNDQTPPTGPDQTHYASQNQAWIISGQAADNPLLHCGLLLAGCNSSREQRPRNNYRGGSEPSTADDGVLTGMEIVGTDLRGTKLVVLSACETGLGRVQDGEGVAGLRQAFQLAGAKSVVATLWQIPDMETAQLMGQFFGNLAGGQSNAEALRHAQLSLINARRQRTGAAHPYYWAAFTLTGE